MSNDVPLTLKLEPGEYQCYAMLPQKDGSPVRLGGMLSLQSNRSPELGLHGAIPDEFTVNPTSGEASANYPQMDTLPLLRVDLVRGNDVLLVDCTIERWMPGRARVTAAAALVGISIPDDEQPPQFTNFTIQVSGSAAVIAPPPLATVKIPMERKPDEPMEWGAVERLPRKITDDDDGADVAASWYVSYSGGDGYAYRIAFSPVIDINLAEPIDLATLREQWLEPLQRITGLSTGRTEALTYLGVELAGSDGPELQVYGTNITQQPYAPRQSDILKISHAFYTYNDGDASLLQLCRGWQKVSAERHPLVETLGVFLSLPPQHPRATFLLLIQALEGLHGHQNPGYDEALAKYKARRTEAREAVANCEGLEADVRKFIREKLPNRPAGNLEDSLKAVVSDLPVDLSDKLSNLDLVTTMITADADAKDWASALRLVRNGLSHGSSSWPSTLLRPAADLLEVIARAHLMRSIGVNEAALEHYLSKA